MGKIIFILIIPILFACISSPATSIIATPIIQIQDTEPTAITPPTNIPIPPATEIKSSRCVTASNEQIEAIRAGIKDIAESNDVKSGWAVKSYDFEKVWFVAVKFFGPGMENGTGPGLWAITGDINNSGMILAVDGFAKEFSPYPDAGKTDAAITITDDGAKEALLCASTQ